MPIYEVKTLMPFYSTIVFVEAKDEAGARVLATRAAQQEAPVQIQDLNERRVYQEQDVPMLSYRGKVPK